MKDTNKSGNERRVRISAAIIYILVSLLCVGMIHHVSDLRLSIDEQRLNIKRNEKILDMTNDLIIKVNEAQSCAQLYTFSGNQKQFSLYKSQLKSIKAANDSIFSYSGNDTTNKVILDDIVTLLDRKKLIISNISKQYNDFNPYDELYDIIINYKPERRQQVVVTTTQDTIVRKARKKNFFERLFSSDNAIDSVIMVTNMTFDTIDEVSADTMSLKRDIQLYSEKGRAEYLKNIKAIEDRYQDLIKADQRISEEISVLLLTLHKQTLSSVMTEIQKSEVLIKRNLDYSIYSGAVALACILIFITLIFHDMKKVAKARREREEALRRTDEIMESRHKLLLSVSHDIKTPLSSIIGYIDLMKTEPLQPQDVMRLNSMKYSSEHILSLLSNLLEFSSLDQGHQYYVRSDFDISELCDQLRAMFSPIAENKQLRFVYHKELPTHLFVSSDKLKIKQIVGNIISNALKYTIEGEVHFGVRNDGSSIIFNVRDSGIGIPESKLNDMFKPFSRAENNNGIAEGNGFGLYVVKGLLDILGGDIKVQSELDKGTEIEIRIPAKIIGDKDCKEVQVIEEQPAKPSKSLNILLVDDDNTLLTVICSMLAKLGHKSDICRSSLEFNKYLDILESFDLVLTDREMGTFTGLDVLHSVKGKNPEMRAVIMTARDEYDMKSAQADGFDGCIKKPFMIKDLAKLLNSDWVEEESLPSVYSSHFPALCAMFDNDDDTITGILHAFVESTADNLMVLNEALNEHDFAKAQAVCHKMKPMFIQLEQKSAKYLEDMDRLKGQEAMAYPEWETDGITFMAEADELVSLIYKIWSEESGE
ncbi:MAG: hybrid sensor histidine kinase/response regulator [Bacteroidales bacterium]|nr:hybrid sensor histidine kinase/response regulator [Bacteroidales bacterium]